MSLSIGIVGLPNVGKSTLFQSLTKKQVSAENYPFCTIEPNVGTVAVPDSRLDELARISLSDKTLPTTIEFIDIAGLVKGASKGEGLGNKFLSNIREVDAICHVVRAFENNDITHVENRIKPEEDAEIINTELILSDLDQVIKIIPNIEKKAKTNDKEALETLPILQKILEFLGKGISIRDLNLDAKEHSLIKSYNFITSKPMFYLVNTDDSYSFESEASIFKNSVVIPISIKTESDIAQMNIDEQEEFLLMLGRKYSGLDILIQEGYKILNLISFFTTGPKQTKAWTIQNGIKAPQAAGIIHSDIERGFIMADIISYSDFIQYEGEQGSKLNGKLRQEGKDYIIKDGDICHFKFNV